MQKNLVFVTMLVLSLIMGTACSKGEGGEPAPPPPPTEETLKISTNASSLNITAGTQFDFNLVVDSKMPTDGVKIEYVLKGESDNADYPQGPAIDTKAATTAISLSGLPRQKFCVCTVTVTSKTKASNKASSSFRVVYK